MAQRGEGQGLQIAVISFAMLTIILAITTYVFYAQASSASKDVEAKTKQLNDRQTENNKLSYQATAMQYVLGLKDVTKEQVEMAKSKAGGDDPDVKAILDSFESDQALVDQAAPAGPRNYRTFVTVLLSTLAKKNASVADAMDQLKVMQQQKDATTAAEKQRADTAVAASDNALADYEKEKKGFADFRTTMETQNQTLASKLTTDATKSKAEVQRANDEKDLYAKQYQQVMTTNKRFKEEIEDIRKDQADLTENPDGHIVRVNQRQQMVWIDRGRADGLLRQTTFAVYDHDENGITSTKKPKGRIEVLTVNENMSEARILQDSPANPIISGDIINTPAWSPGQHIHFAMAMKMDVNKDRVDDFELVKSIIQMNGGVIDAELKVDSTGKVVRNGKISVETRYFVEGEKPSEATSPALLKEYDAFDKERESFNVKKISLDKLLALMGWRAEERTVQLSGSSGGFMKRSPGKTQPAASTEAAPASEGAAPSPAATPADPFGNPPAAAPAAAPADPFGAAPAPNAAPAADADPFATPK